MTDTFINIKFFEGGGNYVFSLNEIFCCDLVQWWFAARILPPILGVLHFSSIGKTMTNMTVKCNIGAISGHNITNVSHIFLKHSHNHWDSCKHETFRCQRIVGNDVVYNIPI